MPYFQTTPGFDECPKCFGWQIRDLTPRDAKGWPIGPANIVDCDHCAGRGEIPGKPPVGGWGRSGFVQAPVIDPIVSICASPFEPIPKRRGRPRKVEASPELTLCPCGSDMAEAYCPCVKELKEPEKAWDEVFAVNIATGWIKPAEAPPAPLAEGWTNFQAGEKVVDTPAQSATGWAVFNEGTGK